MKNERVSRKPLLAAFLAPAALLGAALLPIPAQADAPFHGEWQVSQAWQNYQGNAPARGAAIWNGDVDDTIIVHIHRRDVRTQTVSGKSPSNVNVQLTGHLPERPVTVYLRRQEGRGHIRIVQQPSPDNDFTAAVRIHDPQPGRGHYAFELDWQGGRVFQGGRDR